MSLINWNKPKKVRTTEEHNKMFVSDSGVNGTYVQNMSEEDKMSWKGKLVNKGKPEARVELRKTFNYNKCYSQVLIIVTSDDVTISMNGKTSMPTHDWLETTAVINEAKKVLEE